MKSVMFFDLYEIPHVQLQKLNELSISIPTKSHISKYNSGGRPSRPGDLPFEGFLERRGVPPNLMEPPKILYPSVRSEAVPIYLNTAYKLVHQNLFRLYTDLCKTFKYVINWHRIRGDLIIR